MKITDKIELHNGDNLKFMIEIKDNHFDYSFTSPPYNRKRNDKYKEFNDVNDDYLKMNIDVIQQLLRITKKHVFYNIQTNYYNRKDVYNLIGYFSDKIVDIHIWEKSNPMPASGKNITNAVEYFLILGSESLKSNTTYTKNIITTSVNSNMPKNHKAIMKTDVAEHFIGNFTKENDLIFDCFSGLNTTGIACINLNRRYCGVELSNEYYLQGIQRVKNNIAQTKLF